MRFKLRNEDGVSPVVGVMLMLVVTIIIAAVVSGFAGGIMGSNNQKTPMLSMDAEITNTGYAAGSGFKATVTSVSEPIATNNLKITTSWSTTNKTEESYGDPVMGGATVIGQEINYYQYSKSTGITTTKILLPPYGFGAGVENSTLFEPYNDEQSFGVFTFQQGTGLIANPSGSDDSLGYGYGINNLRYSYTKGSDGETGTTGITPTIGEAGMTGKLDPMQAMLGEGWEYLRAGDVVQISVVYVPTGKVILSKNIAVGE
ncbi:type IV pilin [Methanolacinia paynteri]|uniref:type IV pilin n=1 Tax=Methanolacinia paynteri TaxID=230356 RepID=UPI00064E7AE5|nr:type IV pilin N-terminal domain-containing protein [Methanolacinia paynteri]